MALGATDHIWTVSELIKAALEPSDVPPLPRLTQPTLSDPVIVRSGLSYSKAGRWVPGHHANLNI